MIYMCTLVLQIQMPKICTQAYLINKVFELLSIDVDEPHLSRVPQSLIHRVRRRMNIKLQHNSKYEVAGLYWQHGIFIS